MLDGALYTYPSSPQCMGTQCALQTTTASGPPKRGKWRLRPLTPINTPAKKRKQESQPETQSPVPAALATLLRCLFL